MFEVKKVKHNPPKKGHLKFKTRQERKKGLNFTEVRNL